MKSKTKVVVVGGGVVGVSALYHLAKKGWSDLNSSFKGIDARIPKEMQRKGKQTLQILAESNERLASMYIKTEKPEVAVPLLVETIRIMSPNSPEGKEAYERLIQLGFVETKYKG